MGMVIDNEAVLAMVRELAERRGVTPDEAVRQAVEREVEHEAEVARKVAAMMEIVERTSKLPRVSTMTDDEILGYDEHGIPSR